MPSMPVVHLAKPLSTVRILNGSSGKARSAAINEPQTAAAQQVASAQESEMQKHAYNDMYAAIQDVVTRLNQLYDEIFAGHNEAIAKLSVEIARKVLMRNISDGDYEIESIIKETLKNVPESSGLVVRLNPQDLTDFQKLQDEGNTTLSGIELVADAAIGRAECVVENSKGIVKLLIDEHLEQIGKALAKTG